MKMFLGIIKSKQICNWGVGRIMLAVAVLTIGGGFGAMGGSEVASGAGTGTITGTIVDAEGIGIPDICVGASDQSGNQGGSQSGATGEYTIGGLGSGNYKVLYSDCGDPTRWVNQWYLGATSEEDATTVDVTDGAETGLEAVVMVPGVSVAGRITDSSGNGLSGINVHVNPWDKSGGSGWAQTDANGDYHTSAVADGDYRVSFQDSNGVYTTEYWDNTISYSSAAKVNLTTANGNTHGGFDAVLDLGAGITGRVQNTDGAGLVNICVLATIPNGWGWNQVGGTSTDVNGEYNLSGLPATTVKVQFFDCNPPGMYVEQWWSEADSFQTASQINLVGGETVDNINATMEIGYSLTGRVTDENGTGLAGIAVSVESKDRDRNTGTNTNASGEYVTPPVPNGEYRVHFRDDNGVFAGEYWDDSISHNKANFVSVAGAGEGNIDAVLAGGARVSGTVTNDSGAALENICVNVVNGGGGDPDDVGYGNTDANGQYSIGGLPSGETHVLFEDCEDVGLYTDQWFNLTSKFEEATALNLTAGDHIEGINGVLSQAGGISGTVTDSNGSPVADVCVQASTDTFTGGLTNTDAFGRYLLKLNAAGTYRVQFVDCINKMLDGKWWGGDSSVSSAETVTVAPGSVVDNINEELSVSDGPGTVSGTITNVRGEPVAMCVVLFLPDEEVIFSQSDADGKFLFQDVATGTWTLGYVGCGPGGPEPTLEDGGSGAWYKSQWFHRVELKLGLGKPDPIAQGAVLLTVEPNSEFVANACFGCAGVQISKMDNSQGKVAVEFTTPFIDNWGKSTPEFTLACQAEGEDSVTMTGSESSLSVTGLADDMEYGCEVTAKINGVLVANSAGFTASGEETEKVVVPDPMDKTPPSSDGDMDKDEPDSKNKTVPPNQQEDMPAPRKHERNDMAPLDQSEDETTLLDLNRWNAAPLDQRSSDLSPFEKGITPRELAEAGKRNSGRGNLVRPADKDGWLIAGLLLAALLGIALVLDQKGFGRDEPGGIQK